MAYSASGLHRMAGASGVQLFIYQTTDAIGAVNTAGYFNITSAIDEIQFKMDSGNIAAGDICLYGIA